MTSFRKLSIACIAGLGLAVVASGYFPDWNDVKTVPAEVGVRIQANEWYQAAAAQFPGLAPSSAQSMGAVFMYAGR